MICLCHALVPWTCLDVESPNFNIAHQERMRVILLYKKYIAYDSSMNLMLLNENSFRLQYLVFNAELKENDLEEATTNLQRQLLGTKGTNINITCIT